MTDEQSGKPVVWDSVRCVDVDNTSSLAEKGVAVMKLNVPKSLSATLPALGYPKLGVIDFEITTDSKGAAKVLFTGLQGDPVPVKLCEFLQGQFPKGA